MRYIAELERWVRIEDNHRLQSARRYLPKPHDVFLRAITDELVNRVLFDSKQAVKFADTAGPPPLHVVDKLKLPFSVFYLEFSEPIKYGEDEEGFEDEVFGLFAFKSSRDSKRSNVTFLLKPEGKKIINQERGYVTRTFTFYEGKAYSKPEFMKDEEVFNPDDFGLVDHFPNIDGTHHPDDPSKWSEDEVVEIEGKKYLEAPRNPTGDRYAGMWERNTIAYADLFAWILTYMMAKSINITEEKVSRQVRRRHERKGTTPAKWHHVTVDPKFAYAPKSGDGSGRGHNIRYDVIGHLRFGKHKLKSSDYRKTIEWVVPHQRGLKNKLYVPKTGVVQADRNIDEEKMNEYWESE